MKEFYKFLLSGAVLMSSAYLHAMDEPAIEAFDELRHGHAVTKLLTVLPASEFKCPQYKNVYSYDKDKCGWRPHVIGDYVCNRDVVTKEAEQSPAESQVFYRTSVLCVRAKTVGFISYVVNMYAASGRTVGAIPIMAVHPEFRVRGYGKALVQHALNEMLKHKVSLVFAQSDKDNIAAVKTFKSVGFRGPLHARDQFFYSYTPDGSALK